MADSPSNEYRFRQVSPDRMVIQQGGGCVSIFGFPFFVAGIFVLLMALHVIPVSNASQVPSWGWPLLGLMGLAFFAVGGGLLFGRSRTVMDKAGRTLTIERSLLTLPLKKKELRFAELQRTVKLERFTSGDSHHEDGYAVTICPDAGGNGITLYSSFDYGDAYERGRSLAGFLGLKLEDATSDHKTVIEPASSSDSLKERLEAKEARETGCLSSGPGSPGVVEQDRCLEITIPKRNCKAALLLPLLFLAVPLFVFLPVLLSIFHSLRAPFLFQFLFVSFFVVMGVIIPCTRSIRLYVAGRSAKTVVTVNAEGILLDAQMPSGRNRTTVPIKDLLDIDFSIGRSRQEELGKTWYERSMTPGSRHAGMRGAPPRWLVRLTGTRYGNKIVLKTKKGPFEFGEGLKDDEIVYLYGKIKERLSAG